MIEYTEHTVLCELWAGTEHEGTPAEVEAEWSWVLRNSLTRETARKKVCRSCAQSKAQEFTQYSEGGPLSPRYRQIRVL